MRPLAAVTTAPALLLLWCIPGAAHAHGGIGLPTLQWDRPARGEILEANGGAVELRWTDVDPDDDASLIIYSQSDPDNTLTAQMLVSGISEDCDGADGGPIYTGVLDGGAGVEPAARNLRYCGAPTSACVAVNDCYSWTPFNPVVGNYYIFASLDDDRGDGVPFNTVYLLSPGIIRVSVPGINVPPALLFLEPDGVGDLVDTCFRLRWNANDPDDDVRIKVWLSRVDGTGDVVVAQDISEDQHADGVEVDLSALPDPSEWVVHAEISDGHRAPWHSRAPGHLFRNAALARDGGCAPVPPPDAGSMDAGSAPLDASLTEDAAVSTPDAAAAEDAGSGVPDAAALHDAAGPGGNGGPSVRAPAGCRGNQLATAELPVTVLLLALGALFRRRTARP